MKNSKNPAEALEKAYEPQKYEQNIYQRWEASGAFQPAEDTVGRSEDASPKKITKKVSQKEPFVISLPPPNATGTLHLGHATMLAIEDIMIRQKRMQGHPTLWVPGTDHAAIATQSVVEKRLQDSGIQNPRKELGREKLLEEIRAFVENSKNTIRSQMRSMGASCDWSREKYTLDDGLNHAVNTFFRKMHKDELIYQGDRIVNWDPNMKTTVADDELEYKEEKTKFYYFQYGPVVIGTARPETKFGDKVIVVHPKDKRYKDLHGKEFDVPWMGDKPIKARVITDECIDMELGTGAMTITPAHSQVDFELAEKYNLERPQIIDFDGNLNHLAGEFEGMHITEARPKIVEMMEKKGLLVKVDENYVHNIAVNYRGKGVVEPQIMKQWFVDVNKKAIDWKGKPSSIKEVLQDTVRSGMIKIIPSRFEKIYFNWIDNLRDWCISRQIWWGHRIPMWYKVSDKDMKKWEKHPDGSSFLFQALNIHSEETRFSESVPQGGQWIQDPDTLDTWFSSALWTFSTLGWPEHTKDMERFHPTSVMETGYDILFFWVARMILASTYCLRSDGLPEEKCIPFKEVYLHGMVRDVNGQKMSKSRPETCIDPLDMIEKYGTDAVRLSLVVGSTPGSDMRLYEEKIAGYRNFVNKIWNASRFALMNVPEEMLKKHAGTTVEHVAKGAASRADKWVLTKLNTLIKQVEKDMKGHRYSDAATKIYDFTWGDYCDWYLEVSKGEHLNPQVLLYVLKDILRLLHPFVPFVTEALWSHLWERTAPPRTRDLTQKMLIEESWPKASAKLDFSKEAEEMEIIHNIITAIRSVRAEKGIAPSQKMDAILYGGIWTQLLLDKREPITRMARLQNLTIETEGEKVPQALWQYVSGIDLYIPVANLFDVKKEKELLARKLGTIEKQIQSLKGRLENKQFLAKAPPEVVEKEKQVFAQLEEELKNLQNKMNELEKLNS